MSQIGFANFCAEQTPLMQISPWKLEFAQDHLADCGRGVKACDVNNGKMLIVEGGLDDDSISRLTRRRRRAAALHVG